MCFRCLTEHPASVGESYSQHLRFAWRFGGSMLIGGLACIVHGLLPFLCTSSGSRRVRSLHEILGRHRGRRVVVQTAEALGADGFTWSI